MRSVEYTPADFDDLRVAATKLGVASLCHRPFVDHYYASGPWSRLHLVRDATDAIVGLIGLDRMRFACGEGYRELTFATNFHAGQPGVGGLLYLRWMKSSPLGLVFGGSPDTHAILRRQRWTYFPGVKVYALNRRYRFGATEPLWKRWAKGLLASVPRAGVTSRARRLPRTVREAIAVREVDHIDEDMTPRTSPFAFRFAPTLEYANWRYNTWLSFARYRVFRLSEHGRTFGYVVLRDAPGEVVVAHCDGDDATALAHGVLLSLDAMSAGTREVRLACSHPGMAAVYERFGFRVHGAERPLAVGSAGGKVDLPADAATWLVNLAWGDNDLRAPFLDQVAAPVGGSLDTPEPLRA